jgi:hypothetical protein
MEAIKQPEPLVQVNSPESEERATYLAMRCLQDAMLGDKPGDAELEQRLGRIIDDFDLLFGA